MEKYMKGLALLLLMGSFASFANDRTAYIVNQIDTTGAYVLCATGLQVSDLQVNSADSQLNDDLKMLKAAAANSAVKFNVSDLNVNPGHSICVLLTKID